VTFFGGQTNPVRPQDPVTEKLEGNGNKGGENAFLRTASNIVKKQQKKKKILRGKGNYRTFLQYLGEGGLGGEGKRSTPPEKPKGGVFFSPSQGWLGHVKTGFLGKGERPTNPPDVI